MVLVDDLYFNAAFMVTISKEKESLVETALRVPHYTTANKSNASLISFSFFASRD